MRRALVVLGCLAVLAVVAALGFASGVLYETLRRYRYETDEKLAAIAPLLKEPRFAGVRALSSTAAQVHLFGSVDSWTDALALESRLRSLFGSEQARDMRRGVEIAPSSRPTAPAADPAPRASTSVEGHEVVATTTADRRTVLISMDGGKQEPALGLPESAGRITELRICPWRNGGVAIAIEAGDGKAGEVIYRWATAYVRGTTRPGPFVHAEFLRSPVDYDLDGIVNPIGDTIEVLLMRPRDLVVEPSKPGYVFVHYCPVSGDIWMGKLFAIPATPIDWLGGPGPYQAGEPSPTPPAK